MNAFEEDVVLIYQNKERSVLPQAVEHQQSVCTFFQPKCHEIITS